MLLPLSPPLPPPPPLALKLPSRLRDLALALHLPPHGIKGRPHPAGEPNPYLCLLQEVTERTARLVSMWQVRSQEGGEGLACAECGRCLLQWADRGSSDHKYCMLP